jgi:hypothetical protein
LIPSNQSPRRLINGQLGKLEKPMKYIILTILILCIMAAIILKDKILVVHLSLPDGLLPYYEWLISFPGLQSKPVTPKPENMPLYKTNYL